MFSGLFFAAPASSADGLIDYAQILNADTSLYIDDGETLRPLTTLPKTYFVALTELPSPDGYLSASYHDLNGYVKANEVSLVDFEPKTKYALSAPLSLSNDGNPVPLRALPDHHSGTVLTRLPESETPHYYGTAIGTAQVPPLGETWYYVRFGWGADAVRGYVYGLYAAPPVIPDNVIEPVTPVTTAPLDPSEPIADPFKPGGAVFIVVVVCLTLPVGAVMLALYKKPTKRGR